MSRKIHKAVYFIAATVVMLLIHSCRSEQAKVASPDVVSFTSPQKHIAALMETYKDWIELNVPISVEFTAPMKLSASGRVYMKKDKWIYVSMRFLGMEMVNLYLTKDSIFATDKINKMYVTESVEDVFQGFTIGNVQELLLGRLMSAGNKDFQPASFKVTQNGDNSVLTGKKPVMGARYGYILDRRLLLPESFFAVYDTRDFQIDFSKVFDSPYGIVATEDNISFVYGKDKLNVRLSWSFDKAKWNSVNEMNWKKPSGYKRLDVKSLAKMLGN